MSTFSYSKGAIKAINLLKEPLYTDLFKQSNIPDINILLIFRIYLQSLIKDDKIYRILSQYNSKSFWSSLCSYFLNESVNKEEIGTFISSQSTQIDFSDENVYELYELCKGKEKMLSPVYFSSWSPMPVDTPAEIFVAAILAMPSRNDFSSREDTVIPTYGRKIR